MYGTYLIDLLFMNLLTKAGREINKDLCQQYARHYKEFIDGKNVLDFGARNCSLKEGRSISKYVGVDIACIEGSNTRANESEFITIKPDDNMVEIFGENSFDTVVAFDVFEHIAHPKKKFHELQLIARKNLIISLPNDSNIISRYRFLKKGSLSTLGWDADIYTPGFKHLHLTNPEIAIREISKWSNEYSLKTKNIHYVSLNTKKLFLDKIFMLTRFNTLFSSAFSIHLVKK